MKVSVENFAETREMEAGEFTIRGSPLGMVVTSTDWDPANAAVEEVVIHYTDGSEYYVVGYVMYSTAVASVYDGDGIAYAFNRLVNVDNLQEISMLVNDAGC